MQSIGRSELASIKRAVALSAPKLGLTAELAADRPIPPVLLQRLAYAFSSDLGRLVELVPADHPAWIIKTSLSVLGEALGIASPFAFPVQDKFPFASPNF